VKVGRFDEAGEEKAKATAASFKAAQGKGEGSKRKRGRASEAVGVRLIANRIEANIIQLTKK